MNATYDTQGILNPGRFELGTTLSLVYCYSLQNFSDADGDKLTFLLLGNGLLVKVF